MATDPSSWRGCTGSRTESPAGTRDRRSTGTGWPLQRRQRAGEVPDQDVPDEARDVDPDRAARDAARFLALDAALGLGHGVVDGEAEIDFHEVAAAVVGIALGHVPLLGLELLELLEVAFALVEQLLADLAHVGVVAVGSRLVLLEAQLPLHDLGPFDLGRVEVRAVDAGELHLAAHGHAARAAHAGAVHHDRVRLTMVLTLCGAVTSEQAFIITIGPIATHSSGLCSARYSCSATVTKPFLPNDPSSVHTMSSSQ